MQVTAALQSMPGKAIEVVVRGETSGTTQIWTTALVREPWHVEKADMAWSTYSSAATVALTCDPHLCVTLA